jgi:5-formyltetrahydrofolate cyclo-ligase
MMDDLTAAATVKAALRAEVLSRREALDANVRMAASGKIAARALALIAPLKPQRVALYLPIRSECDTRPLLAGLKAEGIELALPAVVDSQTIVFRRYDAALVASTFGTLAPPPDAPVVEPDIVVVPVAGFDRLGARLGYGRGFYDRALAGMHAAGRPPLLIGIAFSVQEVARIPSEAHDIRVDWIVTENETIDFRRRKD